jgi:phosphatidylglycerophosphatase A
MKQRSYRHLIKNPIHFLSFGLGSGLIPGMPGTYGSFLALFLFLPLAHLNLATLLIINILLFILGCYCCDKTAKALGVDDPSPVVLDEIVAMFFILSFIPLSLVNYILAFVVFRFFDILKPWPVSWCDKNIKGGVGIMVDDIAAAVYSLIVVAIIIKVLG